MCWRFWVAPQSFLINHLNVKFYSPKELHHFNLSLKPCLQYMWKKGKKKNWGMHKPLNVCTFKVINTNKGHEVNKGASIVFSSNDFAKALLLKMAPSIFATLLLHLVSIFFWTVTFPHVVFSFGFTLLVPIINLMVCNLCCRLFFFIFMPCWVINWSIEIIAFIAQAQ